VKEKIPFHTEDLRRLGGMIFILPCVTSGGEALVGLTVMADESAPRGGIFSVKRGIFSAGSSLGNSELRNPTN